MSWKNLVFYIIAAATPLQILSNESSPTQLRGMKKALTADKKTTPHQFSFATSIGYLFNHSKVNLFHGVSNIELQASSPQLSPTINSSYNYSINEKMKLGTEIFYIFPLDNGYLTTDIKDIFFEKNPLVGFTFSFARELNNLSNLAIKPGALATRVILSSKEKRCSETISNYGNYLILPQISLQLKTKLGACFLSMDCTYINDFIGERGFNPSDNPDGFCDPENCTLKWRASIFSLSLTVPL